uniref:Uncharacterized protein n=1 Tax=Moniliophthora roreri TaxID=221103 RepID=A0A0W0EVX3_MONRR
MQSRVGGCLEKEDGAEEDSDLGSLSFPDLDIDTLEGASEFLTWYFSNVRKEHPYSQPTSSSCQSLLSAHPALFLDVKHTYNTKDFSRLNDSDILHRCRLVWSPQFEVMRQDLQKIDNSDIIRRSISGEELRQMWTAPTSAVASHIQSLRIPRCLPDSPVPPVILHDLGSFQREPSLTARINNIFPERGHTFLVNVSGSGKTKLLFEGLCMHWGIYLTSVLDTSWLGSPELHECLQRALGFTFGWEEYVTLQDDYTAFVQNNTKIARRHFSAILFARLLMLKRVLQEAVSQGLKHEHKQRWLELQLQPGLWEEEPFGTLYCDLIEAPVEERVLNDSITKTLKEIIEIWDFTATGRPLYFVLDEANYAVHSHKFSFMTDTGERYPILKLMLQVWRQHVQHLPISFIVAGTEIPREHFSEEEWRDFRWCSDTGSFNDADDHRRYVQRFLPPELSVSPSGEELLARTWRWLRGRHRYTASFMAVLMHGGFESPHHLLSSYVETIIHYYRPRDGARYMSMEKPAFNNSFEGLDFELRSAIHYALLYTLCFAEGPKTLKLIKLVSRTQGRFLDSTMSTIAFDEPIALISAAREFTIEPRSISGMNFFLNHIMPQDVYHQYYFAALCLALGFEENRRIWRFFSLSLPTPTWAEEEASLTRRVSTSDGFEEKAFRFSEHDAGPFVTHSRSQADLLSWLQGTEDGTPFCLHSTPTGEVLIFCLQLLTGNRFWVNLQVSFESVKRELSPAEIRDTFQLVHPTTLFGDSSADTIEIAEVLKSLENPCPGLGPYNILRAILPFNGVIDINHPDFAHSEEPIAALNVAALKSCVDLVEQKDLLEHIAALVTHLPKIRSDNSSNVRFRQNTTKSSRSKLPKAPQPRSAAAPTKQSKKAPTTSKVRKGKRASRKTKSKAPSPVPEQTAGPSKAVKPKLTDVSDPVEAPAESSGSRRGKRQPPRVEVEDVSTTTATSSRDRKRKQLFPTMSTFPPTALQPDNAEPNPSKTPRYTTRSVTRRFGR